MNALIRLALERRLLVLCLAVLVLIYGAQVWLSLPIDIFPNLTRPRVVVMTEAPGLAPEEVETLVTIPLETTLSGATGVEAVRSTSGVGLAAIYVEFGWGVEIYKARQVVAERLVLAADRLPEGIKPEMAPISSILGQFQMIGMWSANGKTNPMEVRTWADNVVRPRLLKIPGIAQVITMGGGRKQFQVLVQAPALSTSKITLDEVERAVRESNENASGGYLEQGSREYLVRGLGRAATKEDLGETVVHRHSERSVLLKDVARIVEAPQVKRGDSSVNGHPAVVLTLAKQPEADTRRLTDDVLEALRELQPSLPKDVIVDAALYQQRTFIDLGIHNVLEALRDGAILVIIILFLFLLNLRTTFITLTAIPLSLALAGIFFYWTGMSLNVMTLGGLAVALGELVDDAIVDIENVYRRLRENAGAERPAPVLWVVYQASLEIRSSIVFGTMVVILVFVPLFALSGLEGRLFTPLGIAYIVSILASLLVSLTVTPVLGALLLGGTKAEREAPDSPLLRTLKAMARPIIRASLDADGQRFILLGVAIAIIVSGIVVTQLGTDFLPPFDEGAAQLNLFLPPGSSLEESNRVSGMLDARLKPLLATKEHPEGLVRGFLRRSGRAELDEHAEGVHVSEYVVTLNPESGRSRSEALAIFRKEMQDLPGVEAEAEQPLAHLISHMLSGVQAQVAIKLFGSDLDVLREKAQEIKQAIAKVPGMAPPVVEAQQLIPQLRVEWKRDRLASFGLTPGQVNDLLETALAGKEVSQLLIGERTYDVVVRLDDPYRKDLEQLKRLVLPLPHGGRVPLEAVARIVEGAGPSNIQRENSRRRIAIKVNATDRDLGSLVAELRETIREKVSLPPGYFLEFGGQFQAQQEATWQIAGLSLFSLGGIFLVLFTLYPSVRIVLQIMFALLLAFVGGVAALVLTGQTLTVASLVGFISLGGIATRNGILLMSHYLHLMKAEGEGFTEEMIMRGSLERLSPVLMTALTAGIGLVPLVIGGQQPGKEILYPVATVILGGLVTSTFGEYLVHPGLFWRLSGRDAERLAHPTGEEASLLDPPADQAPNFHHP